MRLKFLRGILSVLSIAVFGTILLSAIIPIREMSAAPGQIVPQGSVLEVQHFEGGIVRSIPVHAGQVVAKGEPLIYLAEAQANGENGQIEARVASFDMEVQRLEAVRTEAEPDFSKYAATFPDLVAEHGRLLAAERERRRTALATFESRAQQKRTEVDLMRDQLAAFDRQLELEESKFATRKRLANQGYASRNSVLTAESAYLQLKSERSKSFHGLINAEEALREAEAVLAEARAKEEQQLGESISKAQAQLAENREILVKLGDRVERLVIRAPAAGIVHSIVPKEAGAVVRPGETIVEMVPVEGKLIAELQVRPNDIGYIEPGDRVRLIVSTYDMQRDGILYGNVETLSPTTYQNPQTGDYYYKADIALDLEAIESNRLMKPIFSGMVVQGQIVTGDKSLLRYILKPVYNAVETAFSER
ncbi:MAG: HlyD family type I secretion periplasmic adaptor subunit [Hyphomicrobiales bacterium]